MSFSPWQPRFCLKVKAFNRWPGGTGGPGHHPGVPMASLLPGVPGCSHPQPGTVLGPGAPFLGGWNVGGGRRVEREDVCSAPGVGPGHSDREWSAAVTFESGNELLPVAFLSLWVSDPGCLYHRMPRGVGRGEAGWMRVQVGQGGLGARLCWAERPASQESTGPLGRSQVKPAGERSN